MVGVAATVPVTTSEVATEMLVPAGRCRSISGAGAGPAVPLMVHVYGFSLASSLSMLMFTDQLPAAAGVMSMPNTADEAAGTEVGALLLYEALQLTGVPTIATRGVPVRFRVALPVLATV